MLFSRSIWRQLRRLAEERQIEFPSSTTLITFEKFVGLFKTGLPSIAQVDKTSIFATTPPWHSG